MSGGIPKQKPTNKNFVLKKNKITFKPIRNRIKNKAKREDNRSNKRDVSADYKSMPQKISESTENQLDSLAAQQSRNKVQESFAPADLNNMISKGKQVLKNNFFA